MFWDPEETSFLVFLNSVLSGAEHNRSCHPQAKVRSCLGDEYRVLSHQERNSNFDKAKQSLGWEQHLFASNAIDSRDNYTSLLGIRNPLFDRQRIYFCVMQGQLA